MSSSVRMQKHSGRGGILGGDSGGGSAGQVRVFTKKTGHKPDFSDPVVLSADRGGTAVEHLCDQLHKSLAKEFKYALVWGVSTKHSPQR